MQQCFTVSKRNCVIKLLRCNKKTSFEATFLSCFNRMIRSYYKEYTKLDNEIHLFLFIFFTRTKVYQRKHKDRIIMVIKTE